MKEKERKGRGENVFFLVSQKRVVNKRTALIMFWKDITPHVAALHPGG